MGLSDRLFGRSSNVRVPLATVQVALATAIRNAGPADQDLTVARFADLCRDLNLVPLLPDEFTILCAAYEVDSEAWRRLAVLVAALEAEAVRVAIPKVAAGRTAGTLAERVTELVRSTSLLTIEVLQQGELRVEELTRRLFAALELNVAGEKVEESRKHLHRLDYGRLLAEVEQAKLAATERSERLRTLQEEQEMRRTRRGKW